MKGIAEFISQALRSKSITELTTEFVENIFDGELSNEVLILLSRGLTCDSL